MSKKCGCCKQLLPEELFHNDSKTVSGLACYCVDCSAVKAKEAYEKKKNNIEYKVRSQLSASKQRASIKGLEHTLTLEELKEMYPPDMLCPVFGFKMEWGNPKWSSPSLDRIDSTKGYTKDNCHIISNKANKLKNDATLQELQQLVSFLEEYYFV